MEERIYYYSFPEVILGKRVIITSLLIFSTLFFLASLQIAFGFALGVASSLLVFWLNWEGLKKIGDISNPQSIPKKSAQLKIIFGYLSRYFLTGIFFWIGIHFKTLDFYSMAGGFLLPQVFIRLNMFLL